MPVDLKATKLQIKTWQTVITCTYWNNKKHKARNKSKSLKLVWYCLVMFSLAKC